MNKRNEIEKNLKVKNQKKKKKTKRLIRHLTHKICLSLENIEFETHLY